VAYLGDDLPDVPVMRRVGLAAAVADAAEELDRVAHVRLRSRGGAGAARELAEMILKAQGRWAGILERYFPDEG
jgi:3-deoxy-D-manno-octulosonate 8-phosphate phosphatase (KDO 8-P phosphatase)